MNSYIRNLSTAVLTCFTLVGIAPTPAQAQYYDQPILGEMKFFAGDFAPYGWAKCDGQLMSVSQYQTLFSVLGTVYGGDGRTTFGLPDMRGRTPMHAGTEYVMDWVSLGSKNGGQNLEPGTGAGPAATLAMTCIIAVQGTYPSRP